MKVCLVKITKTSKDMSWIGVGDYMLIPKLQLEDYYNLRSIKYKVLHTFEAPDNMSFYGGRHRTLSSLINSQEGAIKTAKTSYRRIPLRRQLILDFEKIREKELKDALSGGKE